MLFSHAPAKGIALVQIPQQQQQELRHHGQLGFEAEGIEPQKRFHRLTGAAPLFTTMVAEYFCKLKGVLRLNLINEKTAEAVPMVCALGIYGLYLVLPAKVLGAGENAKDGASRADVTEVLQ